MFGSRDGIKPVAGYVNRNTKERSDDLTRRLLNLKWSRSMPFLAMRPERSDAGAVLLEAVGAYKCLQKANEQSSH
jgi:hypothetical protein